MGRTTARTCEVEATNVSTTYPGYKTASTHLYTHHKLTLTQIKLTLDDGTRPELVHEREHIQSKEIVPGPRSGHRDLNRGQLMEKSRLTRGRQGEHDDNSPSQTTQRTLVQREENARGKNPDAEPELKE